MPESDNGPMAQMSLPRWRQFAAVVLSLGIFVAIYYQYFIGHETGAADNYSPLAVGTSFYFVLMCALNYVGDPASPVLIRLAKAAGIAFAEVFVFFYLLMFLILNTLGS